MGKIQYGTGRVANLATKKNGTIAITFPKSYTNLPAVVASLNHSFVDTCQVSVYDISKTGCTLAVYNGSAVANTYDITWIAIGT